MSIGSNWNPVGDNTVRQPVIEYSAGGLDIAMQQFDPVVTIAILLTAALVGGMIAHRLSTLANCDQRLELGPDGRLFDMSSGCQESRVSA